MVPRASWIIRGSFLEASWIARARAPSQHDGGYPRDGPRAHRGHRPLASAAAWAAQFALGTTGPSNDGRAIV